MNNITTANPLTQTAEEYQILDTAVQDFDLNKFRTVKSINSRRSASGAGILTIVNSPKNGKRIILSNELMEKLNRPDHIQVRLCDDTIALCVMFSEEDNEFIIRHFGNKGVLYSSGLVREITETLQLDFDNTVSRTFCGASYQKNGDNIVAIISLINQ